MPDELNNSDIERQKREDEARRVKEEKRFKAEVAAERAPRPRVGERSIFSEVLDRQAREGQEIRERKRLGRVAHASR